MSKPKVVYKVPKEPGNYKGHPALTLRSKLHLFKKILTLSPEDVLAFEEAYVTREEKADKEREKHTLSELWVPVRYKEMSQEEKEYFAEKRGCSIDELTDIKALACQLPLEDDRVLLTTNGGEVVSDVYISTDEGCTFEDYDFDDIKAWMPWPEPYEG